MSELNRDVMRTRAESLKAWAGSELQEDVAIYALALLAEVERLTRIVNGYDRTPAEQRATEAEAEVARLEAENENLRGGHEVYYPLAMRTLTAEAEVERLSENTGLRICGNLACKVINYAADRCPACGFPNKRVLFAPDEPADHVAADCPVCRHALQPSERGDATGEARTGPVAANELLDGWMRRTDADDAGEGQEMPDATITIEPDVSGFEAQS